jgi:hypothetical protein
MGWQGISSCAPPIGLSNPLSCSLKSPWFLTIGLGGLWSAIDGLEVVDILGVCVLQSVKLLSPITCVGAVNKRLSRLI